MLDFEGKQKLTRALTTILTQNDKINKMMVEMQNLETMEDAHTKVHGNSDVDKINGLKNQINKLIKTNNLEKDKVFIICKSKNIGSEDFCEPFKGILEENNVKPEDLESHTCIESDMYDNNCEIIKIEGGKRRRRRSSKKRSTKKRKSTKKPSTKKRKGTKRRSMKKRKGSKRH
jgi:hypothetical protein